MKEIIKPFVIERTLNAPVAKVWKAITDKDEMKHWYFDLKEFKAQKGFEFRFDVSHNNTVYIHLCKVTEVIVEKKIAYTWRYEGVEGESLVTWELLAEGNKTRLKLTHEGLNTFPQKPDYSKENFARGWTMIIGEGLKEYVEMPANEIIITRFVNASSERVWEAWTDPKQVVQWWGPQGFTTTIEEMDVRPGGVWKHTMHGPDGTDYPNKIVFKEVIKPERIVFTNGGGKKGEKSVHFESTWTFKGVKENKCKVTIRMVFAHIEDREKVVKEYGAIEGANQTLGRLNEFVGKVK